MKYGYIDAQRDQYPIELMGWMLQVSRSGFFAWRIRRQQPRADADAQVREDMRSAQRASRQLYGRRWLTHALCNQGHCINPKRVRRLMRDEVLPGVHKGRLISPTSLPRKVGCTWP